MEKILLDYLFPITTLSLKYRLILSTKFSYLSSNDFCLLCNTKIKSHTPSSTRLGVHYNIIILFCLWYGHIAIYNIFLPFVHSGEQQYQYTKVHFHVVRSMWKFKTNTYYSTIQSYDRTPPSFAFLWMSRIWYYWNILSKIMCLSVSDSYLPRNRKLTWSLEGVLMCCADFITRYLDNVLRIVPRPSTTFSSILSLALYVLSEYLPFRRDILFSLSFNCFPNSIRNCSSTSTCFPSIFVNQWARIGHTYTSVCHIPQDHYCSVRAILIIPYHSSSNRIVNDLFTSFDIVLLFN